MKLPDKIKWIFFDVGGVIVDLGPFDRWFSDKLIKRLQDSGISRTIDDFWKAYDAISALPGGLVYRGTVEMLIPDSLAEKQEIIEEFIEVMKKEYYTFSVIRSETLAVTEKFSKKYKLGIMGNQPAKSQEWLEQSGVLKYFSHIHMSHHYNLHKPDPDFYKTIIEEVGTAFEESVIYR